MSHFFSLDEAFRGMLAKLLTEGERVRSRNGETLELTAQSITIERPLDRFLRTPGRNNNPFAAIAETMWIVAGRNDLGYLAPYLPRAPKYSDDGGGTWRAGYGPRLRDWQGIDQVAQVYSLLSASIDSRRAVISLFDPAIDNVESNDIPCNNWLHFLSREGRLDLHVVARSTDIWFGFSGINVFEWSVLLEMMARWLHLDVGQLTFFTSSLHLYAEEHENRARIINGDDALITAPTTHPRLGYDTDWGNAATAHQQWMQLECQLRDGASLGDLEIPFEDPMLVGFIRAIDVFWAYRHGQSASTIDAGLDALGENDLADAARAYFKWKRV